MTVSEVAFVPAAPLLVPQVAGGSAELDVELRAASLDVGSRAVEGDPPEVIVVAPTDTAGEWSQDATWDFGGFGVVRQPADPRPTLPWPLGIGGWLLDEAGWDGPRRYLGLPESGGGPPISPRAGAVVVAVGDGSACRTEKAPGYFDERAEGFDDTIASLLARGDAAGLAGVDQVLAGELLCRSLPVWRWVASIVAGSDLTKAELATHVAPYGVGYFAALWSFAQR